MDKVNARTCYSNHDFDFCSVERLVWRGCVLDSELRFGLREHGRRQSV